MMSDLSLNDYLQLTTEDAPSSGIEIQSAALRSDTMWSAGHDARDSTPVNLGTGRPGIGARPKTAPRVKTADLAYQIDKLSREVADRMKLLEDKIEGCKSDIHPFQDSHTLTQPSQIESSQTLPSQTGPNQTLTSQTVSSQSVAGQNVSTQHMVPQNIQPMPSMGPSFGNNMTLSDLYKMPELNDSVQLEMSKLPLVGGGANSDRDTFYRQLVQDTVKQASGKLKIKSGLELESQELVRQVVYWPHAFTSELTHCVKNRKAMNIDIESFIFGTVNILLMNEGDVSHQEKHFRLVLLKHLMYITVLRGWAQARQLHNCILQGIETKAISWQSSASHLAQLASTCASPQDAEKDRARKNESMDTDKIVNIICRSYNSENTQNAECAYSKEGRICNKVHVCLSCAKQGLCFKHPERRCNRRK